AQGAGAKDLRLYRIHTAYVHCTFDRSRRPRTRRNVAVSATGGTRHAKWATNAAVSPKILRSRPSAPPALRIRRSGDHSPLAEETSLIGALIVTHGHLANELLNAARRIETNIGIVEAVPLEWTDSVDVAREKIRQALERLGTECTIIFTDMFGGTPSNI